MYVKILHGPWAYGHMGPWAQRAYVCKNILGLWWRRSYLATLATLWAHGQKLPDGGLVKYD